MVYYKFGGVVIESAGYDAQKALLEVQFVRNGQILQYLGVPEEVWYHFKGEARPDFFFQRAIKGCYRENRVSVTHNQVGSIL